ncbi:MAG: hypothetical protein H6644_03655 [Caldilineaceae bacterium]|nr:hypothetical protein [Caldilineaceae bacterium]
MVTTSRPPLRANKVRTNASLPTLTASPTPDQATVSPWSRPLSASRPAISVISATK